MKKIIIPIIIFFCSLSFAWSQPTWSTDPASFTAEDEVTITVDVSGTSLEGYTGNVWIWSWIAEGCSANCDAPTNIDPAGGDETADAKMTRDSSDPDVYSITFTPVDFFQRSPSEIKKIGFKLKSQSWGDGKQSDNDVILNVEPLTFTPSLNRVFPTKVTKDDVITLYLDLNYASEPALKYELGDFTVRIMALDEDNNSLGEVEKNATNAGSGVHFVRILPTFDFSTNDVTSIRYQFTDTGSESVSSDEFTLDFLDLN